MALTKLLYDYCEFRFNCFNEWGSFKVMFETIILYYFEAILIHIQWDCLKLTLGISLTNCDYIICSRDIRTRHLRLVIIKDPVTRASDEYIILKTM